jgi:fibronectin type 3 domain-containing protein
MKKIIGLLILTSLVIGCKKSESGPGSGHPPGAAALLTPANNEICTTGTVVSDSVSNISFTWNGGQDADSYTITVKNLLTQVLTTKDVSGTEATVGLSRNTPYSWHVTSKESKNSSSTDSEVWKFYNAGSGIVTYAPFPAEIVAPVLGQIITTANGKINLSWKGSVASGTLVGYNVFFGPSNDPAIFKANVTDNFLNDITVSANTTYYWHITTIDSNGNSSDSGLYNFFIVK